MKKYFYRLNIFQRLLLYFIIVIIVSILILTWLIYQHSTSEIKKQYKLTLEHIVSNATNQTDLFFDEIVATTIPVINDIDIKKLISMDHYYDDYYNYYQYHSTVKNNLKQLFMQYEGDVYSVYVIGKKEQLAYVNISRGISGYSINYKEILKENPGEHRVNIFLSDSVVNKEKVIKVVRKLNGFNPIENQGFLVIEINPSTLEDLWGTSKLNDGTILWAFDDKQQIIFHPNQEKVGEKISSKEIEMFRKSKGNFTYKVDGEKVLNNYNHSPETNWTLVATTPESSVYTPLKGLNKIVIIAITLSLVIAIFLSIGFTKSIVRPIRKVQAGMHLAETENWVFIKELKGTDEISYLIKSYNKMIHRVSKLIQDLYKAELKVQKDLIEKKDLELQALESQINPHFLYNTLETISSQAILNNDMEISDMVVALSKMFRYSVKNLEVVTLAQEIQHTKNYLIIEEYRFQKRVNFNFEIDSSLYNEKIVKLTLQPIIENALEHGLHKRDNGQVTIRAEKRMNKLNIEVIDDGRGIEAKKLKQIKESLNFESYHSSYNMRKNIGLTNVNRRIQLIFGIEYGIKIYSVVGGGTRVCIDLPVHYRSKDPIPS